jgi:hypothetical protein
MLASATCHQDHAIVMTFTLKSLLNVRWCALNFQRLIAYFVLIMIPITQWREICFVVDLMLPNCVHGASIIYKKYHPPNNKPNPIFTSPTVFREEAAPVDATILRVALAELEVADPELRDAVPAAAEAEEEAEAIEMKSAESLRKTTHRNTKHTRRGTTGRATSDGSRRGGRGS